MTRLRRRRAALAAVGAPFLLSGTVTTAASQQAPPLPLPMEEVGLPAHHERSLPGGARLLVVPRHGMPFVTVNLILPGGRTADPAARIGLAELTAGLLVRGTETRGADEIRRELDFRGAELEASAGSDWTTVTASVLTPHLPAVLELMADVVLAPSFPPGEVGRLRSARLADLEAALEDPAILADRTFLRAVYGDHPYGRVPSPATLAALDRPAVVDFHRRWYRPGGALFVVAGDVEPDRAAALVAAAFADWPPGSPPDLDFGLPPLRHEPRVVLVHRPGADRAVVRVGHTVVRGSHPDWTALSTLSHVLGGGPSSRLFRAFREERDLGPAAWTEAQRRLDRGFFRVAAETRTARVVPALEEIHGQLLRVRQVPVTIGELRGARDFLAGSFPLQLETPAQLASHFTTSRLLGIPDSVLSTYRGAVSGLAPDDLREVAERHIQPDEMVFVVVGDARWYHQALEALGEVTVVDPRGRVVDPAVLRLPGPVQPLDAGVLGPARAEYRVWVQDRPVGTVTREVVAAVDGRVTFRGVAELGPQTVEQAVTFTVPGFRALSAEARTATGNRVETMNVRVEEGRLVGTARDAGGIARDVDQPFPDGALLADMSELVVWVAELRVGEEFRVPVVDVATGAVRDVAYRVTATEEVAVPAGIFQAFRVEVEGAEPQTVWARVEAPHVPLRIRTRGRPVTLELTSWTGSGPPPL